MIGYNTISVKMIMLLLYLVAHSNFGINRSSYPVLEYFFHRVLVLLLRDYVNRFDF